jgi:excinuclease ABC subunit C
MSKIDAFREKIKSFPIQSGVYLMMSSADKIIYVGKAKNIRNRLRSYFQNSQEHQKTLALVRNIHEIEYILTKTEVEAFLLEASLIKKHRPKYNIRLKDDKSYPYIKLSWGDKYPRLYLSRRVKKDEAMYFGPYTSGAAVFGTIRFLNRFFKIRDCTDAVFKTRKRPCMTHQIGRCSAPCVNLVTQEEYRSEIEGALLFLKGKNKQMLKTLKEKMQAAAEQEKFEVAARLRDSLSAIKSVLEKQSVIDDKSERNQDVIGYRGDERGTLIETLHIRQGRVLGTRSHFLTTLNCADPFEDPREWLVSFLNQYYEDNIIPDDLLLPIDLGHDLNNLLEAVLKERSGHKTVVRFATDPQGRQLLEMAQSNANAHFDKQVSKVDEKMRGLDEIKEKLNLVKRPLRIECFDISTFQGTETVASQVVFEEGLPSREDYRRYKIKDVVGTDDYASMREVLSRRFQHKEYEDPDLLVVDGGKGQLTQAVRILKEIGRQDIPVVGLAKARTEASFQEAEIKATEERFFLVGRSNPVTFRSNSEGLHILVGLRDEAHRFAITYHRKLREDRTLASALDEIIGLGEKRKRALLQKFGSVEDIKKAEPEEIAQMKTFNRVLAERILVHLSEDSVETAEEEA